MIPRARYGQGKILGTLGTICQSRLSATEQTLEALGALYPAGYSPRAAEWAHRRKDIFVAQHSVEFVWCIDDEANKPTMAQTTEGGNCDTRVRKSMQIGPPIRGHVREAQRRQAARPRVLIIVFRRRCVDHMKKGISAVVRKEQGNDAKNKRHARARGDMQQARSLKNGLPSNKCNGRLERTL